MSTPAPTAADAPAAEPSAPATVPAAPAPPVPASPSAPAKKSLEDSLAALDDETKTFVLAEVKRAREEAKSLRDRVKETDPAKVRTDLLADIAKAMGVSGDEPPDPKVLTEQLTASTSEARQAKVELAVYRAASTAGADPAALLDSRSFLEKLAGVDPTDAAAVTAAVTDAVAANPAFATAPARRAPGPVPAAGTPAPDLETQIAAAQKVGDFRTVIALQNQKLLTPQQR